MYSSLRGWAVEGRDAHEAGGLAPTDAAELGHGGVQGAEAGDGANDGGAAGEGLVGVEGGLDRGVELADLRVEGLHDGGAELVECEFGAQLAQGVALRDELAPKGEQVAEAAQGAGRGRGGLQAVEEAVAGQHGGVDLIVLGAAAEGLGEAPAVQRVGEHGLEAGVGEALVQGVVVAAGGFEDDARDAELAQPVAQGATAALVIGEAAGRAGGLDMGVERGLADVDAGDYDGFGHSCVPILSSENATRRNRLQDTLTPSPRLVVAGVLRGFAAIPRLRPGTQERPNAPASARPACDGIAVSSKVPQRRARFSFRRGGECLPPPWALL